VIAYSTMSQIGYMFLGAGLGSYANGMFHLMTHAFFKALLFMGAGLVIHALGGEQDIRRMRGIGKLMPLTRYCFLIGALALVGLPPFAGFFSKDSIISAAMARGGALGYLLWAGALVGALLTGLYTFRMYYIVFPGEPSEFVREHYHEHHGREGPFSMTAPVVVLAVLSVIGGWLQFAPIWTPLTKWLAPVARTLPSAEPTSWQEGISSALAVGLGVAGVSLAGWYWGRQRAVPRVAALETVLQHKFYFDELYDAVFYRPTVALAQALARWIEGPIVFGSGIAAAVTAIDIGREVRRLQTGLIRTYALALGAGIIVVGAIYLGVRV
jgi:NADH-quinone oxidoreductase subunit L